MHTPEGMPLPPNTLAELQRDMARLGFVVSQIKEIEDARQKRFERGIMTGIGPVAVRAPRIRDRVGTGEERIAFSSAMLPPYARRSKSLEVLIPILYLKGISTGGFEEALAALLGKDAGGLSASTIARLRDVWVDEHARWLKRDLSVKRYVYFWADGIHVQARLEDDAQCLLVIIGATPEGNKELVGATREAVDARHRHHVAGRKALEQFEELAPVAARAGHLLPVNLGAARSA